jgi:glycine/D-amino acid oxidase-like deaminating enzyme
VQDHVVIVGGGIAGVAAADALAGTHPRVTLIERESSLFRGASGQNAAIFRPVEESSIATQLALRSRAILNGLSQECLRPESLLLAAESPTSLVALRTSATLHQVAHRELSAEELYGKSPALRGGRTQLALEIREGGVLNLQALMERLVNRARSRGVQVRTNITAFSISSNGRRVTELECSNGERISLTELVVATGASSLHLSSVLGVPLPLMPHRRHLAWLAPAQKPHNSANVNWDVETGVYFRNQGANILASPGDHVPHTHLQPEVDPEQSRALTTLLPSFAPTLVHAEVQQIWACLRTMTPDCEMIVGRDPRIDGLSWFVGLGGHGMSGGLAAAHVLRDALLQRDNPLCSPLSPARFVA